MKKQTEKRSKVVIYKVNSDGHSRLQKACVKWFRYQYPEYRLLFMKINNDLPIYNKELRIKLYNRFKEEGLLEGAPDHFLAVGNYLYNGLFIEFKTENDRLRKKQVDVIKSLEEGNYRCVIVRSLDEFIEQINSYMRIK